MREDPKRPPWNSRQPTRAWRQSRGLLLAFMCVTACGAAPTSAPPLDVLVITIDTLRADYLGAYGDGLSRTPRIDALAHGGTVFENAAAPMPLTRPSHFSLLTSRYPREHGVLNNRIDLPESAVTLAEIFSSHGYQTGAFVSVVLLDAGSGAGQGFDAHHHPTVPRENEARETVSEARRWLTTLDPERPFFLWVHLFEPHLPYAPETGPGRPVDSQLRERFPSLNWKELYRVARENRGDIPQRVVDYAQELYRSEIEVTDRWVGELLEGLEGAGRRSNTLIVLTADHGEPFENGVYFEHADSLFDGAIRIPLIVNHPAQFPAGKRVDAQVSLLDVAPTVLQAAGLPIPSDYSGVALQEAEQTTDRYVLIQHPFYQPDVAADRPDRRGSIQSVASQPVAKRHTGTESVALVGRDWKLIRSGAEPPELYARARPHGPDERVREAEAELLRGLEAELARQLDAMPLELIDPGQINDELRENLKALGYAE